uniref:non-reducing end alpha-L-arabinofuranosidase n=1 Tax=Kalanchoe fedtschenkoi TaxID=63787 RepID=A0A7N0V0Y9_KALFE
MRFSDCGAERILGSRRAAAACGFAVTVCVLAATCFVYQWLNSKEIAEPAPMGKLIVDASEGSGRKIPDTMFGVFFEEINHAGAGGLWAELVSNRGFEAGGSNTPSKIDPWAIIGDPSSVTLSTDLTSRFERNMVALRVEVRCDSRALNNVCPAGGVGFFNPGYWGMNIEQGKAYRLVAYVRSSGPVDVTVSLTGPNGFPSLAASRIILNASDAENWTRIELLMEAGLSGRNSRLQFTTEKPGVLWFDQVSLMPLETYKGHGFHPKLAAMLEPLKPRFLRFPGGCYVEGTWLRNAFRWKATVGPWEERPGHLNDVWNYWTDDGLGYFEFLQLAEDLGALPIWVFNSGMSHREHIHVASIFPFVQEALDGIEFARGDPASEWGSLRAAMGHPEPFELRHVAVGNEDCWVPNYRDVYLKFYHAIKLAYPDIRIISNCDGSAWDLDHPADYYDFHIYETATNMFSMGDHFAKAPRTGPKAFVSEYAVTGRDGRTGTLLAALGEAAFLISLEKNSDVVEMASYAPLFVNANDRSWNPDAIVFNSSHIYGTPSYYMQQFFRESGGATLLPATLVKSSVSGSIAASAITWRDPVDSTEYLKLKVVNFGKCTVDLEILINGLDANSCVLSGVGKTELTSSDVMHENSFSAPEKVIPRKGEFANAERHMTVTLAPHSLTSFDMLLEKNTLRIKGDSTTTSMRSAT